MPFRRNSGALFGPGPPRRWPALVLRLIERGTQDYPPKVRRRLMILNAMAYLIAIFSALFALTYAFEDFAAYRWAVAINLGLVAAALCVPFAHRYGETTGAMLIMAAEYAGLFGLVALLGRASGIQLNLVVGAAIGFAVLGLERIRLIAAILLAGFALHVVAWFWFPTGLAGAPAPSFLAQLYLSSALTAFGVTAAVAYYAFRLAARAEAETEALLRNILPDKIVERLKQHPDEPVAESFSEASVLFSDLKSFVPLARSLGPARTVEMLNDLIRRFDKLASEHGVEKIKTIGDAYMAAAGLDAGAQIHYADAVARMAVDMHEKMGEYRARTGEQVQLRIGIGTGPVVAGVIGKKKFIYDMWGDTVNVAFRMAADARAGIIQVDLMTYRRLHNRFRFDPGHEVEIKGKGRMKVFHLIGPVEAQVAATAAR
ncbi:MAG: adenylate/guanylate cyclase domain-containing protein [Microvirga sp.]